MVIAIILIVAAFAMFFSSSVLNSVFSSALQLAQFQYYEEYYPNQIEESVVEIQAIGAGALNQAIKSIAIARGYVAPSGKDLVCIPAFRDIEIDGLDRTAIKIIVEQKR